MFEKEPEVDLLKCNCCYSCISFHSLEGCKECVAFLKKYFPSESKWSKRSTFSVLKVALVELFDVMGVRTLKVEDRLTVDCTSFLSDFLKVVDEIKSPSDIVKFWHLEESIACKIFSILHSVLGSAEVLYSSDEESEADSEFSDSSEVSMENCL